MMKELIISNWPSILIVALFALYAFYLVATEQWIRLRETAYMIMLKAEKIFKTGQGRKKFDYVFEQVYDLVPAWVKIFVSRDDLRLKLQEWYNLAKDYTDDGYMNNSYK